MARREHVASHVFVITRIYLAGPEVFLPDAIAVGERKKALCLQYGCEGVFPLDNVVDLTARPPRDTGIHIGQLNEQLIRSCDAVIANMTPFRGPSADVGTAYEMGFAAALGLTVCAYSNTTERFHARTIAHLGVVPLPGSDGHVRDADGLSIENFDLHDNLMLESCIEGTGGVFVSYDAPSGEVLRAMEGFEGCLRHLAHALK